MYLRLLAYVFLVVISDPYKGINYDRINFYEIKQEYLEDVVHYHEPDPYGLHYNNEEIEEEEEEEKEDEKDDEVFIPWKLD